ncbi:MAG: bifunctional phosphopantothenoylcysteine decarboxylase/phosphopantothenate--cysteine ligase CoaBC [Desulfofustis sp.]
MPPSFAGKRIVVGVTGSIAAFKVAGWVSALAKEEALVDVVMTTAATKFVSPLTFGSLSGRPVFEDMFSAEQEGSISHIGLSREADCILIAPATAHTIARLAYGLADDLLSTTVLAARIPVIICPAMNVQMYDHPATARNMKILKDFGYLVIEPESGLMACGEEGSGRLPEWEKVAEYVLREISTKDLEGQRVLVTAGPTREPYDPVRFLSNRSSGKMGYALARTAFRRGAEVTLISGPTTQQPPAGVELIKVTTAMDMHQEVMARYRDKSVIVKAAAVSDFRWATQSEQKIKKDRSSLVMELEQNPDILKELGALRDHGRQLLIGFAAESSNIEEEGRKKLLAKGLDLIAVNDISSSTSGFEVDNNQITLIDSSGVKKLLHTSKIKTADLIWDHVVTNKMLRPARP